MILMGQCLGVLVYIMSMLKMIYHNVRPYMKFDSIRGYECSLDFGKPSGHAMVGSAFYFLFFYLIILLNYGRANKQSSNLHIM